MSLFRRSFSRRLPDRLLEISERIYVFDCCLSPSPMTEAEYKTYFSSTVKSLHSYHPNASCMVFNFREEHNQSSSLLSDILIDYDMTVVDYPRHYEGYPLLPLEMIYYLIKSGESWLSLEGHKNVILMHCESGGWPVMAFMLAGLLLYRKQYSGEQKTLEMVCKQAPKDVFSVISNINPRASQLRYLKYITGRDSGLDWPPSDAPRVVEYLLLWNLPVFDGGKGCRPVVRVYGQEPSGRANRSARILFSSLMAEEPVWQYPKEECVFVKIGIHCQVQGDIFLECIHLYDDLVTEEIIFKVMFHTGFVQSNILSLNCDEVDVTWNTKHKLPKDFRAEVLFRDINEATVNITMELASGDEGHDSESEFFEVEEIFTPMPESQERKAVDLNTGVVPQTLVDNSFNSIFKAEETFDDKIEKDCTSTSESQERKVDFSTVVVPRKLVDDSFNSISTAEEKDCSPISKSQERKALDFSTGVVPQKLVDDSFNSNYVAKELLGDNIEKESSPMSKSRERKAVDCINIVVPQKLVDDSFKSNFIAKEKFDDKIEKDHSPMFESQERKAVDFSTVSVPQKLAADSFNSNFIAKEILDDKIEKDRSPMSDSQDRKAVDFSTIVVPQKLVADSSNLNFKAEERLLDDKIEKDRRPMFESQERQAVDFTTVVVPEKLVADSSNSNFKAEERLLDDKIEKDHSAMFESQERKAVDFSTVVVPPKLVADSSNSNFKAEERLLDDKIEKDCTLRNGAPRWDLEAEEKTETDLSTSKKSNAINASKNIVVVDGSEVQDVKVEIEQIKPESSSAKPKQLKKNKWQEITAKTIKQQRVISQWVPRAKPPLAAETAKPKVPAYKWVPKGGGASPGEPESKCG